MDFKNYNMSYFDCINERFSCRSFSPEKVSLDKIEAILESARLAPTAVNFQPEKIYVVENETLLEKLKEATKYLFDSKTVFVICYDKEKSWHRGYDSKDHGDIDAAIVTTHMMLASTALGLGSCYVCSFKEDVVKSILGIPENYVVSAILPIGYPKNVIPHNKRCDLEDIVIYK